MPKKRVLIRSKKSSHASVIFWTVLSFLIMFATAFAVWYGNADIRSRANGDEPYFDAIVNDPYYRKACTMGTSSCIRGAAADVGEPYQSCILECQARYVQTTKSTIYELVPRCESGMVCQDTSYSTARLVKSGTPFPDLPEYSPDLQNTICDINHQRNNICGVNGIQYCEQVEGSNEYRWSTCRNETGERCTNGEKRPKVVSYRLTNHEAQREGTVRVSSPYEIIRHTCLTEQCYAPPGGWQSEWRESDCTETVEKVFPANSLFSEITTYLDESRLTPLTPTPSCTTMANQCTQGDLSCGPKISGKPNTYRRYKSCVKQTICGKETWVWSAQKKGTVDLSKCK